MPIPPDLGAILHRRQQEGRLASFYLVTHPQRGVLEKWCLDFLEGLPPGSHQDDVVQLVPPDGAPYRGQDLEDFFRFARFPPAHLPWKYLFLHDPHRIPPLLAHKLLKTLEEGPPQSTIFFLHYTGGKILETIRSRAVLLRLPPGKPPSKEGNLGDGALAQFFSGQGGLAAALEETKSKEDQDLIPALLHRYLGEEHSGLAHVRLLESLRHFDRSATYHNSPRERYAILLHALRGIPPA